MSGIRQAPLLRRLAWFLGLWMLGVSAVAIVGWGLGLVLRH